MARVAGRISETAYCRHWGSELGARRVLGLSAADKEDIAAGKTVLIHGPTYMGCSVRRVVRIGESYYARMPHEWLRARCRPGRRGEHGPE
jgi:hypothetical protein